MPEQGKVKWFSNVKGYGFLEKEGLKQDIFVHYSVIVSEGYKRLNSGEEVTFELVQGEKGPQAQNVVRAKKEKKPESPEAAAQQKQPSEKPAAKAPEAKKAEAAPSKAPQETDKSSKEK